MTSVARRLSSVLRWHRAADNDFPLGSAGAATVVPRGYGTIDDPAEVGIAIRELQRAFSLISQFADVAAESVDVPAERAVGIRASTALVTTLIRQAEARREELVHAKAPRGLTTRASGAGLLPRDGSIASGERAQR